MARELASKINLPNSCSSFSETRARMALAYVAGLEVPNGLLGCSLSKASALTCINAAISTISRVILGGMSLDLSLLPLSKGLPVASEQTTGDKRSLIFLVYRLIARVYDGAHLPREIGKRAQTYPLRHIHCEILGRPK